MSSHETGQVDRHAAEVYATFFVPALFQPWASRVASAAGIKPGQRVLDVACGTGVLAREAADRVGPTGMVIGVDVNEGMLAVARAIAPALQWIQARAEALPQPTGSVDVVDCQFGLMFFEDRLAALGEMSRVLRPGGRLAVAVWDALEHSPGYAAMTVLLQRLFGDDVAAALDAPFILGDRARLESLFTEAGIPGVKVGTEEGTAHFPSIHAWVETEITGWTLADVLDDAQVAVLQRAAERHLASFVMPDGTVAFRTAAHIVTATKG